MTTIQDRVDAVTLTAIIDQCLDYSMDGRLPQSRRTEFLATAKRLRGALVNLLSARFEERTKGLSKANADLEGLNRRLEKEARVLADAAGTLADLAKIVGSLDKLLGVATRFL